MPRWLAVPVTLALFTAVMLAVGWVLKLVVPSFNAWLVRAIGQPYAFLAVATSIAIVGALCLWPRDSAGRMRRLSLRR